ncbi:MAG: hypothetical protein P1U56_26410 [Saprospiraceae bacterium]|nr:hypothetical protein [Saprospiraceae bacterium]
MRRNKILIAKNKNSRIIENDSNLIDKNIRLGWEEPIEMKLINSVQIEKERSEKGDILKIYVYEPRGIIYLHDALSKLDNVEISEISKDKNSIIIKPNSSKFESTTKSIIDLLIGLFGEASVKSNIKSIDVKGQKEQHESHKSKENGLNENVIMNRIISGTIAGLLVIFISTQLQKCNKNDETNHPSKEDETVKFEGKESNKSNTDEIQPFKADANTNEFDFFGRETKPLFNDSLFVTLVNSPSSSHDDLDIKLNDIEFDETFEFNGKKIGDKFNTKNYTVVIKSIYWKDAFSIHVKMDIRKRKSH